jgi:hypothetical protein
MDRVKSEVSFDMFLQSALQTLGKNVSFFFQNGLSSHSDVCIYGLWFRASLNIQIK